jgi:hypothetical protein
MRRRRTPRNPRTLLTWLGLAVGVAGLGLQFYLSMPAYLANGRDIFGALGTFFAFYTILTNIVLVLIYASEVTPWPRLDLFRHPVTRGMMAANITLVMLFVYFVLRHLYALEGLSQTADTLLHYLAPVLYVMWWLIAQRHGALSLAKLPVMLAPTFGYFLYILARGVWVAEYPYPILDVTTLGYPAVWLNAVYMTVGLAGLCAVVIALDQILARSTRTVA